MRLFIAQSIDGFIADEQASVGFLDAFPGEAYGYDEFYASVDRLVMGRTTFDQMIATWGWPYAGKPAAIVTSHPLRPDAPRGAEAVAPDAVAIAEGWRDAWIVGGGRTIALFLEKGLITEARLFTVPIVLGRGVRLFPGCRAHQTLRLVAARAHDGGVVEAIYWGT